MNAIILAAGMGTRLRPLTNNIPKCMVKVNGVPMVERQIQFLHEANIKDITLVSGYKAERLEYLKEKYDVNIIFNEKFDTCNNIYSMVKALDIFQDSWIIEGDIYMHRNCFTQDINQSTYFAVYKQNYINEWGLKTNESGKLQDIVIGNGTGLIMSGISFWTKRNSILIKSKIQELINKTDYTNFFWDNAVIDIHKSLDINVTRFDYIYEIDTEKELIEVERITLAT